MADNKTHSYSTTKTSSKSTNDMHELRHPLSDFNTSALSVIPPYSHINSCTASVSATKNPTGTLNVGSMKLYFANNTYTGSQLAEVSDINFKGTENMSGTITNYVSSKASNSGNISNTDANYNTCFCATCYFTYLFSQQFTSTLTVTWNYNEPRAKVSVSKTGEGTVTGSGTYHYGTSYTITATASTGWKFVKWSDGNTNASRTFTVNKSLITAYETSKSYQAIFEVDKINKIYVGTSQPSKIYFGTSEVKEVYVGTTKVYG
jgi:hypothetical protein